VQSLRRLIDDLEDEIDLFGRLTRGRLVANPGYTALQQLPGVGPVLGAVFVAEVGDVSRFRTAPQLACWTGLTPKHHESDTHVHRGRITKQGSRLVRWAAVESVKTLGPTNVIGAYKKQVADRRGKNIGTVAAARKQVEFVFYALRDHHVRALHPPRPSAGAAA
jgi:transposase